MRNFFYQFGHSIFKDKYMLPEQYERRRYYVYTGRLLFVTEILKKTF